MFGLKMMAKNVQLRPGWVRPERDGTFWPEYAPYFRDNSDNHTLLYGHLTKTHPTLGNFGLQNRPYRAAPGPPPDL